MFTSAEDRAIMIAEYAATSAANSLLHMNAVNRVNGTMREMFSQYQAIFKEGIKVNADGSFNRRIRNKLSSLSATESDNGSNGYELQITHTGTRYVYTVYLEVSCKWKDKDGRYAGKYAAQASIVQSASGDFSDGENTFPDLHERFNVVYSEQVFSEVLASISAVKQAIEGDLQRVKAMQAALQTASENIGLSYKY